MNNKSLIHISDTHGELPKLNIGNVNIPLVIHSGDFMPNSSDKNTSFEDEVKFQEYWLRKNAINLIEWLDGKKFIFCAGNHDFCDPIPLMRDMGIDAYNATNNYIMVDDLNFYGFPYITMISNRYNYCKTENEISNDLDELCKNYKPVDVFISHSPPSGFFDSYNNKSYGSTSLRSFFEYKIKDLPKAWLCGHIHNDTGIVDYMGIKLSQAAEKIHIIYF